MRRGGWARAGFGAALALAVASDVALAAGRPKTPAVPCTAEGGETVAVRAIGEDFSLALADGRTVRVAGIDPVRDTPTGLGLAEGARSRLAGWLVGKTATLRPLGSAADRWGRLPALLFAVVPEAAGAAAPLSVAVALVDAGLARGRPEPAVHACWPAIAAAEAAARGAGLGLWSDPYYAVRDAGDLPSLGDTMGDLAIVQGRVTNVGQTRSRIYLDMGPIHRSVALRVERRAAFIVDQFGLGHDGLVGRTVRARGTMDDRNGPHIDLADPDQIEIVGSPEAPETGGPAP